MFGTLKISLFPLAQNIFGVDDDFWLAFEAVLNFVYSKSLLDHSYGENNKESSLEYFGQKIKLFNIIIY